MRLANLHFIIYLGGFLLEAKAFWGHTCIAGGLFSSLIQLQAGASRQSPALKAFSPENFFRSSCCPPFVVYLYLFGTEFQTVRETRIQSLFPYFTEKHGSSRDNETERRFLRSASYSPRSCCQRTRSDNGTARALFSPDDHAKRPASCPAFAAPP